MSRRSPSTTGCNFVAASIACDGVDKLSRERCSPISPCACHSLGDDDLQRHSRCGVHGSWVAGSPGLACRALVGSLSFVAPLHMHILRNPLDIIILHSYIVSLAEHVRRMLPLCRWAVLLSSEVTTFCALATHYAGHIAWSPGHPLAWWYRYTCIFLQYRTLPFILNNA